MKRREVIALISGFTVWSSAAHAQKSERVWRIGYLSATESPDEPQAQAHRVLMEAALARFGYVEGKNLIIERRLLNDRIKHVNEAAATLVALQPDAIIAVNTPDVAAALAVTKTIPIVFVNPADPVGSGFIDSLARPGGNATGTTGSTVDLIGKRLELFHEIAGTAKRVGFVSMQKGISPPLDKTNQTKFDAAVATAEALGLTIAWRTLSSSADVDALFASVVAKEDQALYVVFDPLTIRAEKRIADLAVSNRMPTMYEIRDYVESGGLVSYTYDRSHNFERVSYFLDKIFKGAKPAELPVEQPTKFELVVNLKTAKALGLSMPASLLARADEVIE